MSGAVGRAYDARADEYVALFGDVARLAAQDRALVARWRDSTTGVVLDAGCGPGQRTGWLRAAGRTVVGLDVSAGFLAHARRTQPGGPFARASLTALPLRDRAVGGVLAWFSTIHLEPEVLPGTFRELRRVLADGGSLLLGHVDGPDAQPFPHQVTTAYTWTGAGLGAQLEDAGFVVAEVHRRSDPGVRPVGALLAHAVPTAAPRT